MRECFKPFSHNRGTFIVLPVIVIALIIAGIFLSTAPAFHSYTKYEAQEYEHFLARTLAESGIDKAMAYLQTGKILPGQYQENIGKGKFTVDMVPLSDHEWKISSYGSLSLAKEAACVYVVAMVKKQGERLIVWQWQEGKEYGRNQK